MKVITTRVDEKYVRDLEEIEKEEKAERAVVIRKLLGRGIKEWKIKFALEGLEKRNISIGKAAEIAEVSYADMLDLMAKANIDIGYTLRNLEKDIAELQKG